MEVIRTRKRTMKTIITTAILIAAAAVGRADTVTTNWTSGFSSGGVIADGNLAGWSDTRTLGGIDGILTNLSLSLSLNGGNNGDLYAYLVHDTGFCILLNRVGRDGGNPFGYSNPGMSLTFSDAAPNGDIHFYGGLNVPVGFFQPDARNISPLSSGASLALFDRANSGAWLNSFTNLNPNGTWTLFVADVVGGGTPTTVQNWGLTLDIQVVPEPSILALALVGLGLGLRRKR